jgi:hypothetical protein
MTGNFEPGNWELEDGGYAEIVFLQSLVLSLPRMLFS